MPREGGDTLGAIAHAAIALPYAAFTQPARFESTDVNVGDWDSHSAMLLRPCFSTMSFFDVRAFLGHPPAFRCMHASEFFVVGLLCLVTVGDGVEFGALRWSWFWLSFVDIVSGFLLQGSRGFVRLWGVLCYWQVCGAIQSGGVL